MRRFSLILLCSSLYADMYLVDTPGDMNPTLGGTQTSATSGDLRYVLNAMNYATLSSSDAFTLEFNLPMAGDNVIQLQAILPPLAIFNDFTLEIDGSNNGSTPIAIDGANSYRGLFSNCSALTLSHLTMQNCKAQGGSGSGGGAGLGGGLFSIGTTSLSNVTFTNCSAVGGSGGSEGAAGGGGLGGNGGLQNDSGNGHAGGGGGYSGNGGSSLETHGGCGGGGAMGKGGDSNSASQGGGGGGGGAIIGADGGLGSNLDGGNGTSVTLFPLLSGGGGGTSNGHTPGDGGTGNGGTGGIGGGAMMPSNQAPTAGMQGGGGGGGASVATVGATSDVPSGADGGQASGGGGAGYFNIDHNGTGGAGQTFGGSGGNIVYGDPGMAGDYGGGGGSQNGTGGSGGFAGGGGGTADTGGDGGGGGQYGGGGGTLSMNNIGSGGPGGGPNGLQSGPGGGGGGAGLGGAIFVYPSSTLHFGDGCSVTGSSAVGGAGSIADYNGAGAAGGILVSSLATLSFEPSAGQTITISDSIGDDSSVTLPGGTYAPGSGAGAGITKANPGTLVLNGTHTYSGLTDVTAGTLVLNGSISGDLAVENGATLKGSSGSIAGNLHAITGGTVSPGNSIGAITTNTATFDSGTIFAVEINAAGESSQLHVTTGASLGGNVSLIIDPGTYAPSTQYLILDAGSISGAFNPTVLGTTRPFGASIFQSGNDIYLIFENFAIPLTNLNGNARKVAQYLNAYAPLSVLEEMFANPEPLLKMELDSISPARNNYGPYISLLTGFSLSNILASHIDNFRASERWARNPNSLTALLCMSMSVRERPGRQINAGLFSDITTGKAAHSKFSTWISGFGEYSHQQGQHQNPLFRFLSEGGLAGFDYHGDDMALIGAAFGYAHTHFTENRNFGSGHINYYYATVYANVTIYDFYITPAVWGSFNPIHNKRHVFFNGSTLNAHAEINAWQAIPYIEAGYDFKFSWGDMVSFASGSWGISWQGSYREKGTSPFNAKRKDHTSNLLRAELGLKFTENWEQSWGNIFFSEKASFITISPQNFHDFETSFSGIPGSLTLTAIDETLNLATVGLNASFGIGHLNPIYINLGCQGELGPDYWSAESMLTIMKNF